MVSTITRDELKAKLDRKKKLILAEALPETYYRDRHLPGAINIPHDQVDALAPVLLLDKSAEIVVYCANAPCRNSGVAAHRLVELGYTNVRDYHEGKRDWIEAGLPVERGKGAHAQAAAQPGRWGSRRGSRRDGPASRTLPHAHSRPFSSMKAMWLS